MPQLTPLYRRALARALLLGLILAGATACDSGTGLGDGSCEGLALQELPQPGVYEPDGLANGGVCVRAEGGAEVVVVATVANPGAAQIRYAVDILGSGFQPGSTDMVAQPSVAGAAVAGLEGGGTHQVHEALRDRERYELTGRLRALRPRQSRSPSRPSATAPTPARLPGIGESVTYNTAVSCDAPPAARGGRVVAVTDHTVVVADAEAGIAGFDDGKLEAFGRFFDDHIHPTLGPTLGEVSDVDGNGRIVLFFTPASNGLTPPGSTGVVGGFFWGGDLFPATGAGEEVCPSSSEAEILYLSVPDPGGVFGTPVSEDRLYTRATMAHEYQHLVNASQRVFFSSADELEETWLNEGLSYISEELVFYAVSGLQPRSFLSEPSLRDAGAVGAFNEFVYNSVGRFNVFLLGPHFHSVRGSDGIETRGAAWSFLRYALDRSPREDEAVLQAVLGSRETGLANLGGALGIDPVEWMADWTASIAALDLEVALDARFQQPSWDLATIMRDLRADSRFPLGIVAVPPDQGVRFSLRTGSAGYGGISLEPGRRARIEVRPVEPSAPVRAFLVRVR